jgi:hypothetical protein
MVIIGSYRFGAEIRFQLVVPVVMQIMQLLQAAVIF